LYLLEEIVDLFLQTFTIAVILIVAGLAVLGIGFLLTGKHRFRLGSCGTDPTKNKNGSCGTKRHCSLCDNEEKEEKKP
jgi:hypothetical protein